MEKRKQNAKEFIRELMVLTSHERDYLKAFAVGKYKPELLFSDEIIIENIQNHPMAQWKMEK